MEAHNHMEKKGTVSIHAQNIMPVIKRWLYSDKDIFLRELVSNGCDAISKHKMLALKGEVPESTDEYRVDVILDEQNGTIQITDNGIGMTADEVEKYIAQVAFSGAEEFLAKYKEEGDQSGIIGHFGLGFYSAFMVSSNVVIDTLSYQDGAESVRWSSADGMEYQMEPSERTARGTTITLTISDEEHEFLHRHTIESTLEKYCAFMPVPIYLNDLVEPKEGEEPKAPVQINDTTPLWMKAPSEVTDEEYKAFYHKVFHDYEEPLFWIHLNADYPFNLKGILYFPKIRNEFSGNEGVIKLYNNQVFVADNIKEVIPEFLMLLKGAIDCPDLPLNVSRSFLQNDGYVKKMSAYITRKVADRLVNEFTNKREEYQRYWDDIHPFIKYGCLKDAKFYERVKAALLFKTVDGRYLTIDEYKEANGGEDCKTIYYTTDEQRQAQMIALFTAEQKDVVVLNTVIDTNFISFYEYTEPESLKFQRVDGGTDDLAETTEADEARTNALQDKFRKALGDEQLTVKLQPFKSDEIPAMITVDEQTRRFSEMSRMFNNGIQMPEQRTLVLNEKHPLTQYLEGSTDEEQNALICAQLLDLSDMAREPLSGERMVDFLKRSNALLGMLIKKQ
ncbi:molecular chaperone HtpG [Eubacteriales bacterium OttesenSCG-928-N13]|nr:molecular chaperone HtpG [Eubacteriales bacterium OttesenSCG-928-N13]